MVKVKERNGRASQIRGGCHKNLHTITIINKITANLYVQQQVRTFLKWNLRVAT